jgi:hypothetical protein
MTRLVLTLAVVTLLVFASVTTVSAHGLTIEPQPGKITFDQPVSTDWAQAHCNAQGPAAATGNSNGVVTFTPAEELPCPTGPGEGAPGR